VLDEVSRPFSLFFHARPDTNRSMAENLTIGFLGAGKMATALAKGFIGSGLVSPDQILASDLSDDAKEAFASETGARTTAFNPDVVTFGTVLLLAVKPDQVASVLAEVGAGITERHLLVSVAAGVTLAKLEAGVSPGVRVIRVMPNTPALVGASATAYALGSSVLPQDSELAGRLFSSVGLAISVKEPLLDAVTGLSGSGPAYAYLVIEALSDGAVAAGLPRDIALRLSAQTLLGSAKMVLDTGLHLGQLKDMVTSPGGTTIEGIHELEKAGLRGALMNAVRAAAEKARKLGQS
jgi:pyrroline-5-carboxylate reductase